MPVDNQLDATYKWLNRVDSVDRVDYSLALVGNRSFQYEYFEEEGASCYCLLLLAKYLWRIINS